MSDLATTLKLVGLDKPAPAVKQTKKGKGKPVKEVVKPVVSSNHFPKAGCCNEKHVQLPPNHFSRTLDANWSGGETLPNTRGHNSAFTKTWDHIPLPPEPIHEYVDDPQMVGRSLNKEGRTVFRRLKK